MPAKMLKEALLLQIDRVCTKKFTHDLAESLSLDLVAQQLNK